MSSRRKWMATLAFVAAGAAACGGQQAQVPGPAPATVASVAPVAPGCAEGRGDCDGSDTNACETDLTSTNTSCGACGNTCSTGTRCVAGTCRRQRLIAAHAHTVCGVVWGRTQCWGDSLFQHGTSVAQPVRVPAADGATHISVGFQLACAVLPSGEVVCWGDGKVEELPGVDDAVEVEVGTSGTYVVRRGGGVQAFDGRDPKSLLPLRLEEVVSVASGLVHDCALHRSGEVTCWGSFDLLGAGSLPEDIDPDRYMAMTTKGVKVKHLSDAVQITASYGATCAVRRAGDVVCWGNLDRTRDDLRSTTVPVRVPGIEDAVEVTLNEGDINHDLGCVVRAGGALACWGDGTRGATGSGDPTRRDVAEVKGILDGVAVAAGMETACALRAREAMCWGSGRRGALGNGTLGDPRRPARVPGVSGAVAVGLGEGYSCALDGTGQITCWGDPAAYTTVTKRGVPPRVISKGSPFKSLFASRASICALDDKGVATCFDPVGVQPKETLSALGPLLSIRRDDPVSVALSRSGQVVLFARGGASKQPVTGVSDAVSVAQSTGYGEIVCAVRRSGRVSCAVYSKDLFDSAAPARQPAPRALDVAGISDATAIVFGGPDFCVLRKNGDVACFSARGLVPPAQAKGAPASFTPALRRTAGVQGVALTALRSGLCALREDGSALCWGSNHRGVLGVGDDEPRTDPTPISYLPDAVSMDAFPDYDGHACAAAKSGEVFCWGANQSDQAGQWAASFAFTPVKVDPPPLPGRRK